MKQVILKCNNCLKMFERDEGKYKQAQRMGHMFSYCCPKCAREGARKNRSGWQSRGFVVNYKKEEQ